MLSDISSSRPQSKTERRKAGEISRHHVTTEKIVLILIVVNFYDIVSRTKHLWK